MKAIVTGATGFVGKWLVQELLKQNDEVFVVVRDMQKIPDSWKEKVHTVVASLENLGKLTAESFEGGEADVFFHLAWAGTSGMERADVNKQLQNVQATCEAVKLAKRLKCKRFLNAGSIMEYEAMKYLPTDYSNPGMGYIYSSAKLTADFMAKTVAVKECISYVNVIISNIYGVGECSERFFNTTLKKMMKDETILLTHGMQLYDFIYVEDAVRAIALVGKEGQANNTYYIGNEEQYPLKEFVLEMKEALNSKSELLFGKIPFQGVALTYEEFDTKKMKQLGFSPKIDFKQGVNLTKKWMEEN